MYLKSIAIFLILLLDKLNLNGAEFVITNKPNGEFSAIQAELSRLQTLNISILFNPVPSKTNEILTDIDYFTNDIMSSISLLTSIQSQLTSPFGLNSLITNVTLADSLSYELIPLRSNLMLFYATCTKVPLSYKDIFNVFSYLSGSVSVMQKLAVALKDKFNFSEDSLNTFLYKIDLLARQDINYFRKEFYESKSNQTIQKFISEYTGYLASSNQSISLVILNLRSEVINKIIQSLAFNNVTNKLELFQGITTLLANTTEHQIVDLLNNINNNETVDFLILSNLKNIFKYLDCNILVKIRFQDFLLNIQLSSQFDSAMLDKMFRCNLNFTYDYFNYYLSRSQLLSKIERQELINYYTTYRLKTGNDVLFSNLRNFIQDISGELLESVLLVSYLKHSTGNTINFTVIDEFFGAMSILNLTLYDLNNDQRAVILKHTKIMLSNKSAWSNNDWDMFIKIFQHLSVEEYSRFLLSDKKYQLFVELTRQQETEYWARDCEFSLKYYQFLLYVKKSLNESTSLNYNNTRKLLVCKNDCDFSEWITGSATDAEIKSLAQNYLPYLSQNGKKSCQGSQLTRYFRSLIQNMNNITDNELANILNSGLDLKTIFTTKELSLFPRSILLKYLPQIADMQFDRISANSILNKIIEKDNYTNFKLSSIGNLLVGIDVNLLNSLDTNETRNNLDKILNCLTEMDNFLKELFIQKYFGSSFVKSDVLNIIKTKRADLIELISLERIKQVNLKFEDLTVLNIDDGILPASLVSYLVDEHLKSNPVETWSLTTLKNANQLLIKDLSAEQTRLLIDKFSIEAIKIIGNRNNKYKISSSVANEIINGLRRYSATYEQVLSNGKHLIYIDEELIGIIFDEAFSLLSVNEYKSFFEKKLFGKILDRLAKLDPSVFNDVPISICQSLAWFSVQYLEKENSTLTVDDVKKIGPGLAKFIPYKKIKQISIEHLSKCLDHFQGIEYIISREELKNFRQILIQIYVIIFDNDYVIAKPIFGSLFLELYDNGNQTALKGWYSSVVNYATNFVSNKIPQIVAAIYPPAAPYVTAYEYASAAYACYKCKDKKCRRKKCKELIYKPVINRFSSNLPIKEWKSSAIKTVKKFFGRRRRSLQQLSCEEVRQYKEIITAIDPYSIESMDDNEFLNCLSDFGKYDSYETGLVNALKAKISKNFISNSNINDTTIIDMNNLVLYFNSDEMNEWKVNDLNTIAAVGKLDLNKTQAQIFAVKTKSILKTDGSFSATDLKSMGNIICGLSSQDISNIDINVFKLSVTTFSSVNSACDENDFSNFMNLAKQAYPIELWTRSKLNELGNIVSGINQDDLEIISNSGLMSSISDQAFTKLNLNVLNKLTSSDALLSQLNKNQLDNIQKNLNFKLLSLSLQNNVNYQFEGEFSRVASTANGVTLETQNGITDTNTNVNSQLSLFSNVKSGSSKRFSLDNSFVVSASIIGVLARILLISF